ncbi:MAG: cysteine--tRNA ligase [Limisphaerales bacterium]
MAFKLFNTLSRQTQEFVPLDPTGKNVGLYCCGPTVHDFAHIGNFRTFVFADLTRRYLQFKGYGVRHVTNVTDVEDKIIKRVNEAKSTLREYTAKYEQAFFEDLQALGCLRPHETPHATEHMGEIIALIQALADRGMTYRTPDGSVYFSIEKYQRSGGRYGQLLNLNFEQMRPGQRVASDDYAKDALADFALWKGRTPDDGSVFWTSPWGEGRPGWHIECSAMSMELLGPGFDLHLGGEDLIFPHHENEIAQSQGAGRPFVKYWLHGAHLLVENKKMSKSLGNFFTLRDLLQRGFNGREIRYLLLTAHYREPFNFTLDGLRAGRAALGRLDDCLNKLRQAGGSAAATPDNALLGKFTAALDEDLNVSAAWGAIFDWVRDNNRLLAAGQMNAPQAASALAAWGKIDTVLGLGRVEQSVPAEVLALLAERQSARKAKDFKRADAIRNEIQTKGWVIEDIPGGEARVKKQ